MIEITFDTLPPSSNHTYFIARRRLFKTKIAWDWQKKAIEKVREHRDEFNKSEWYGYVMFLSLDKNLRDIDSCTKIVQDSLAKGFEINDNRVALIFIRKIINKKQKPYIKIYFGALSEIENLIITKISN